MHKQQKEFVENLENAEYFASKYEEGTISSSSNKISYQGDKPMNKCLLDLQLTEEERLQYEKGNIEDSSLSDSVISSKRHEKDTTENSNERPITDENIKERIKAHFWVYCSRIECGRTLQPGKLRVRCVSCKEGAIIVKSDPCNWDDVLNAGRIEGYCQNSNCNFIEEQEVNNINSIRVRGAEFYFKCSGNNHHSNQSHDGPLNSNRTTSSPQNDQLISEAPALYLIRSNLKEIPCLGRFIFDQ